MAPRPLRALLLGAGALAPGALAGDRPILGVLTTPLVDSGCITYTGAQRVQQGSSHRGSCFHSIYVKWIEGAGGRVVPLRYDAPDAELDATFDSLNGLLFTGGETNVSDMGSRYMAAASRLLSRALAANAAGEHVPVWGTCMGIQTLSILVAGTPGVLRKNAFDSESLMLPLELPAPSVVRESRFLQAMPRDVLTWLLTENITVNLHHDGVLPGTYNTDPKLSHFFRVVSTNVDRKGVPFVSTVEGRTAPVYGVQWHPERPQFQFSSRAGEDGINHSPHAVRAMQAVANFLVDEARRNARHFASPEEEAAQLIYNYAPVGPPGDPYQAYMFPPASSQSARSEPLAWV